MKIRDRGKKQYVRIIIGMTETGSTKMLSPIKTIPVEDTNVEEMYELVMDAIKKRQEEGENIILKEGKKK